MRRIWIWSLPVAIVLGTLWLSHQSTLPIPFSLEHPRDWLAHGVGYAALALTLELALRASAPGLPVYRRHLLIFALVSLFGLSDEFHQAFVPGRTAAFSDWLADTLAGGVGLALSCWPFARGGRGTGTSWHRGPLRRPDPALPLILVADPHWSAELTGLRAAQAVHPQADWLFLGDAFEVWVGLPGMETPLQAEFLDWVDDRRREGRWVGFWLGNREYFLDGLAGHFDLMGEGLGGELKGEALAWEHGDLVNGADRRYRLWNLVSRSGPVWLFARLLPRSVAQALAEKLQRALHTTNAAYKLAFPREAFRAAAAEHPGSTFLTGHFHTLEREANGIALPWAHEGTFMVWQHGTVAPLGGSRQS